MADPTNVAVVVDKVTAYLDTVASKLGVAAGKVWPWLVKQQVLEGATTLIGISITLVATVFSYKVFKHYMDTSQYLDIEKNAEDRWERQREHKDKVLMYRVVWGIVACCLAIFAVGLAVYSLEGVRQLLNPEYYALMDLIKSVK